MPVTILVTGGAGFVGSHTVLELLKAGFQVVVVDNLSNSVCTDINQNSLPVSLQRVEKIIGKTLLGFYSCDILDEKSLEFIFERHCFDAVIHFAALKSVSDSCRVPLSYYRNNLTGTIVLLETMKRFGVKKIIFSSSSTVYGSPEYLPIDEGHPTGRNLTNPYGRTKYFIEELLNDVAASENSWCVTHLRYFNPVGAHESGLIGEDPNGEPNNLMPYVSQVAVGRRPYIRVYGQDFNTPDGTGIRDYIHIMDLSRGHVLALDKMLQEKWTGSHVYNLGTGHGYSVLEVIRAFEKVANVKIPFKITSRRIGDIDVNYADATKAYQNLGWKAIYSLEDMCKHAWNWQTKNPDGFRTNPFEKKLIQTNGK